MAENKEMPAKAPKEQATPAAAKPAAKSGSGSKLPLVIIGVAFVGVIVIAIGGYVGYKMFFSTPSPKQVCEKVQDLMIEEYKNEMDVSQEEAEKIIGEIFGDLTECIAEEEESRKDYTSSEIREYSNCIMDAKDFSDLEDCDIDRDF